MTPKEKAQKLLYIYLLTGYGVIHDSFAKKCALIAVDEIIKVACDESDYDKSVTKSYFLEVKQEIEKL